MRFLEETWQESVLLRQLLRIGFGFLGLFGEEQLEILHEFFERTALDDFSNVLIEAEGSQGCQGPRPGEHDVDDQPLHLRGGASGNFPVGQQSWLCGCTFSHCIPRCVSLTVYPSLSLTVCHTLHLSP